MENPLEGDAFLTKGATVTFQEALRGKCFWDLLVSSELSFGEPSISEADPAFWLQCT